MIKITIKDQGDKMVAILDGYLDTPSSARAEEDMQKLLELNTKYDGKMWRGPRGGQRMGRPGNGQRRMDGNRQAPDSLRMRDQRPPREGMGNMEEMRKTMEAYDAELKEILTEEQYKQYRADQEERMKRGPQGWGERGNRPERRQRQE